MAGPPWRPATADIPDAPGVYRFREPAGRIIYVGKAKSLRNRLNSYFADPLALHPRTAAMVAAASGVDWVVVGNEVEALQLEYSWIKEYDPRFNVKYRDDKSYPYLAITMGEEFPRAQVMRGEKRRGTRYFGPYAHAWAIRETLDLLLRVFPMRTCSNGVFRRARAADRPCLLADIGKCSAPCVGRVTPEEHREIALDLADFLSGRQDAFLKVLNGRMKQAAADLDFETAARYRDDIGALTKALQRSAVVLPDGTDADVFGVADDELEASVQVFHVRGGRIAGQRGFVLEKSEQLTGPQVVATALQRFYGARLSAADEGAGDSVVPRRVLVPEEPDDGAALADWLADKRGGPVRIAVPRRGDKRDLLATVVRNAEQSLALHKTRRSGDLTSRTKALTDLTEYLELPTAPLRIECFDVSHLGGQDPVASMVVFEDGLPRKSHYRTFAIRDTASTDDTRAMAEVLTRRFRRQAGEGGVPGPSLGGTGPSGGDTGVAATGVDTDTDAATAGGAVRTGASAARTAGADGGTVAAPDPPVGRPDSFAYEPTLLVVDGGAPQVAAASAALQEAGVSDIPVIGLAKRLEEVWLPDQPDPVILPRGSDALYLLQRVRDEAHRFAISAQRKRRAKRVTASELDSVPGLGAARKKALLRHFGSVKRVRAASPDELAEVPGIGPGLADSIARALAPGGRLAGDTVGQGPQQEEKP